jgi:putative GTP pyrophosphokinase
VCAVTVLDVTEAPGRDGWAVGDTRLREIERQLLVYRFGIDEVMTKITILRDEFRLTHAYNPIEHLGSRLKSYESIVAKARRKGIEVTPEALRAHIFDIAGVRITCSFVSDLYRVRDMLLRQRDLTLLEERDYIARPKATGYKSLHLIVQVPVYLSDRVEDVVVEIQLRTIAMDLWASLEHKIYYKYEREVPRHLTDSLKLAADVAWSLDRTLERIHHEVHPRVHGTPDPADEPTPVRVTGTGSAIGRSAWPRTPSPAPAVR